ncbi:MAG: hypothetical protein SNH55_04075 [Rikenellaceae bacterium]
MKKLLYLALIAATTVGFISCEKDDNDDDPQVEVTPDESVDYSGDYSGDMVVSKYMYDVSTVLSESEDVSYSTVINDSSITVTMNGIQFVSSMPALDIVLPNIPEIADDSYVYYIDTVTPTTVDGEPYDTSILVSLDNVEITINTDDNTIDISYECTISTTSMGDLVCYVEYTGVKQ